MRKLLSAFYLFIFLVPILGCASSLRAADIRQGITIADNQAAIDNKADAVRVDADKADMPRVKLHVYGDWTLHCITPRSHPSSETSTGAPTKAAIKQQCEIEQTVEAVQNGKSVQLLQIAVSAASDDTEKVKGAEKVHWAFVVLTPLDVLLTSGFALDVGRSKPAIFPYRNCNHLGCFSIIPLNNDLVGRLKRQNTAAAYFRLLNGQAIKVIFSLKGFTKAFTAFVSQKGISEANEVAPVSGSSTSGAPISEHEIKKAGGR